MIRHWRQSVIGLEMQDALVRGLNCFVPEQKPSCQIIQTSPRISRLRPGVRFAHTAKDTKTKVAGWNGALWKTSKDHALTRKDMGVSLNGGTPNLHPKMIIFSSKTHGCWVPPF